MPLSLLVGYARVLLLFTPVQLHCCFGGLFGLGVFCLVCFCCFFVWLVDLFWVFFSLFLALDM